MRRWRHVTGRVSVRTSVWRSPIDRQQRRAAGLLLSAGACSRHRSHNSIVSVQPALGSKCGQRRSCWGTTLNTDFLLACAASILTLRGRTFYESKKGKVFPYSLPSVGSGADPGVQAVSPQVTWSESRHRPGSRLPLLSARPAVTSVAFTRWRYL